MVFFSSRKGAVNNKKGYANIYSKLKGILFYVNIIRLWNRKVNSQQTKKANDAKKNVHSKQRPANS